MRPKSTRVCSVDGCGRKHSAKGYCKKHHHRFLKNGDPNKLMRAENGTINIKTDARGYRSLQVDGRTVLEHRWVMARVLGRPLLPNENVHHINGNKSDNRPENLELWNTHQPVGQRVEDAIKWAKELLALYEPTNEGDGIEFWM